MTRFIHLSKHIINENNIVLITKAQSQYYIYMKNAQNSSIALDSNPIAIKNHLTSPTMIKICKNNDADDYDLLTNWTKSPHHNASVKPEENVEENDWPFYSFLTVFLILIFSK